ncbi:hypothetical protein RJT34_18385 [Clitoria ternatea]|uniref:Protein kinase domain-containing protein n=1 Tax=Clitoria ternatea TaxID=43366 RepID=A0AAN9PEH9_CLITE
MIPSEIRLLMLLLVLQSLHVNSYNPADSFAVNCGSPETTTFQKRTWVGDVGTTLFSIIPQTEHSSVLANPNMLTSSSTVPFTSARISRSKFSYSFPIPEGPRILRLHFYSAYYDDFVPYNALFSVKAGNFSLLKDFNASLWVVDDKVIKEYCINIESDERLNVTFLPSTDHLDAYAFINGIEVVSMPPFLYYTDPNDRESDPTKFQIVGGGSGYQIQSDRALENLYRVNVGGNELPPSHDTGMFRSWENDHGYLQSGESPLSIQTGFGLKNDLIYKSDPNYTAPSDVYLSARSYGQHENANYNVTWEFEADSEFSYMIRLHFCEFDPKIQKYGDRAFQIFIADALVEERADVIGWSGGNLIPVYKDYVVLMPSQGRSKKVNLSIKLQRLPKYMRPKYRDVLLNGIEIFKISDSNNSLAGPNPDRGPSTSSETSKSSKTIVIINVSVVAILGLLLFLSCITAIIPFPRRKEHHTKTEWPSLPSYLCRYFTITELRAAANNFDDTSIIGVGGFGSVYKGSIDGATPIAIKRLKPGSEQGASEFKNEVVMLSQLRHPHLVPLIGYCNDGAEMILVYDFMPRGTLREHLYNSSNQPLPWKQRLEILLGAANGLHYLHAGAKQSIIHRDVKSSNILLDENWVAKVSDLGLSKLGPSGISKTHVTTMVKGSYGYLDPEYYKTQRLTLKSDVYSFGVVLLEVLCGRPPLDHTLVSEKVSLVDWVRRCYDEGEILQTVDPFLKDGISAECLECYCQMALSCVHDDRNQRPLTTDVIEALEIALHLVETQEDNNLGGIQEERN